MAKHRAKNTAKKTVNTQRWQRSLGVVAALLLLLSACSLGSGEQTITEGPASEAATALPATAVPAATVPASPTAGFVPDPTATPVAAVDPGVDAPPCLDVPTFNAATTVSVACDGDYAVSPELFASNAGWHLFQAQGGQWVEIDYAMTCCNPEEVPFVELLIRNGLSEANVNALCAGSEVGPDSITGCASIGGGLTELPSAPVQLRVNGMGDHNFGAVDSDVLASISTVFGPPLSSSENSECGAGPMTIASFDDFSLNFQSGEFVGWYYESSNPGMATPSGVSPGLIESELIRVYDGVDIFTETLGKEFYFEVPAGYMGGFFDEAGTAVSAMFAGTTCFFR